MLYIFLYSLNISLINKLDVIKDRSNIVVDIFYLVIKPQLFLFIFLLHVLLFVRLIKLLLLQIICSVS